MINQREQPLTMSLIDMKQNGMFLHFGNDCRIGKAACVLGRLLLVGVCTHFVAALSGGIPGAKPITYLVALNILYALCFTSRISLRNLTDIKFTTLS